MASVTEPTNANETTTVNDNVLRKHVSARLVPEKQVVPEVIEPKPTVPTIASDEAIHSHDHTHQHDGDMKLANRMIMLGTVVIPLLGLAAAIALAWQYGLMSWLNLAMLIGGWYLTGLGITIGYHRMLTHRSFDTVAPIRWFWTAMGALAVEGSPIDWCMVHRKHHQFSDHHGDPHSPHLHEGGLWNMVKGFCHSHTGWMFNSNWSKSEREKYVPDLMNDRLLISIDEKYYWWVTATLVIPTVIGGVSGLFGPVVSVGSIALGAGLGLLWGGLARVCLSHHMTWSINSICHIFGSQDFKSSDDSRNNLFFGIFSHGEGWHNNHHAFPTSARHGLKWWQLDLSWIIIRGLELCGLAWDVKLPSRKQMESRAID